MSKYKKQHYIPRCYLHAWCDPDTPKGHATYVWRFSSDGKSVHNKAPENILHESEMYTIVKADGERDLRLEHGLQQLETSFSRIGRNSLYHRKPSAASDRLILCAFISAIFSRTKAQRDHWIKQWGDLRKTMEEMTEWSKNATPEERKRAAHIKGSLSNLKKTDANKYCSISCILKEMVKSKITRSTRFQACALISFAQEISLFGLRASKIKGVARFSLPAAPFICIFPSDINTYQT